MNYKITINNPGNHFCNPLLKLADREYTTREEACEAIYAAMYDIIDGEIGCEMVNRDDVRNYRLVVVETKYGDKFAVRNNKYNYRGEMLTGWETVKDRLSVCSPEEMVATGQVHPAMPKTTYRIVSDETVGQYSDYCHDYILREGYATNDGVTATVEEVGGEKTENLINLINAHPELHAELINGLVEVTPSSGEPLTEPIEDFVRRIAGNAPFELATLINRDNESDRLSFEVEEVA